ncbi:DUF4232 domain-containing protein [Streptomyces sp. NPDC005811]|uniref:DUF4232 domain-containing protein n=1 Tax=Streptomyces sp. NPDC005811 TaxID=3154565 RepID=UPI0033D0BD74
MRYGVRGTAWAVIAASAALAVSGCGPDEKHNVENAPTTTAPRTGSVGACPAGSLEVTARQAAERPDGTGTGAAVVAFTNASENPCVLQGHPTVAGAGNGSPDRNRPLKATPSGSARPVTVGPGGTAWVKLTFVQVQGEADGFCASGADPVAYPTLVVGLPGSGRHQVALDDGQFAECDDTVTVSPVSATEPA